MFWESPKRQERLCAAVLDAEGQRAWHHGVVQEWGDCGKVAFDEDGVAIGCIKYAPSSFFPQSQTFGSAPKNPSMPLITCLHIEPYARQTGLATVLLRAALRDLAIRGERTVECFALAKRPPSWEDAPMPGIEFLLRNGFTVSRPDPVYPLLQLELRSLVLLTENLEAVLESLKLPLRMPGRVPAPGLKDG